MTTDHPMHPRLALTLLVTFVLVLAGSSAGVLLAQQGTPTLKEALEAARAEETSRVTLIARLSRTVVAIFPAAPDDPRTTPAPQGSGSGVLIDARGHALTNYHVVGEAKKVNVGLSDGTVHTAVVKGRDPTGDIAVIQLEGGPYPYALLGDSDRLDVGEWVLAMGNPFGLATDFKPTVTQGVISGLHRFLPGDLGGDLVYTDSIQVDAPINPGNSGGPLFNLRGELVGINGRVSARPSRGRVNTGVGFAIPINQIKGFLPDLVKGQRVHHAVLGVELSEGKEDVEITRVVSGTAAEKAGLKVGDVVRRFAGREIETEVELINRIGVLPAGSRVRIAIERDKRTYDIEVVLGERPTSTETVSTTPVVTPGTEPAPADTHTDPAVIARRFGEALGGYDAIDAIEDTISTGTVRQLLLGRVWVSGTILQYDVGDDRIRRETTYRVGTRTTREITVFDGQSGWTHVNGVVNDF
ncbi:MAG TPA: trypsin-like peptidase domain-containing protein, partial [Planctomycetota bacterium]|nr:trypsin-like peptidase domain-containing protein [Planctomycetota bacterium]